MSKRLIQRQQVIDCGAETCGKCEQKHVAGRRRYDWCLFFEASLRRDRGDRLVRCYQCKNAEVKKP
jgi:hypothetical protein